MSAFLDEPAVYKYFESAFPALIAKRPVKKDAPAGGVTIDPITGLPIIKWDTEHHQLAPSAEPALKAEAGAAPGAPVHKLITVEDAANVG